LIIVENTYFVPIKYSFSRILRPEISEIMKSEKGNFMRGMLGFYSWDLSGGPDDWVKRSKKSSGERRMP
jgi:hypothetical protein